MNEIRKKRLESAILREISELIMRMRIRDDRLGLVSVTQVDLADDLGHMTVLVSPFGSEAENAETVEALAEHAKAFQTSVGRDLRLRQTPRLQFALDDRIKEGDRIIEIMDKPVTPNPWTESKAGAADDAGDGPSADGPAADGPESSDRESSE